MTTQQRDTDFAHVRVGTTIGFEKPTDSNITANKPYKVTRIDEDGDGWFNDDNGYFQCFSAAYRWTKWRGYIISQPDEAPKILAMLPSFRSEAVNSDRVLRDVIAERERQKSVEGWTSDHDDAHASGEMASAAAAYAFSAGANPSEANLLGGAPPVLWPWDRDWWKPTTPRRDAVKAAALLLAEIERLDRAAIRQMKGSGV